MASPARQEIIRQVYEDPETGFGSVRDTYRQANARDPGIRYIDVKAYLDRLAHRQAVFRPRGYNTWVSPGPLFEFEVDLIDLTAQAEENDGHRYALVAIDSFTKVAHAVPMRRKTADSLISATSEVFEKIGTPKQLYSDYEGAFESPAWRRFLNERGVKMVQSVSGAQKVERFNRTLKAMLQTRLDAKDLSRDQWLEELGPILKKYNATPHETIEMAPNDAARPENELVVAFNLAKNAVKKRRYPNLSVGDRVRVLLAKDPKRKGYEPRWSTGTFRVYGLQSGNFLVDDGKRRVYHRHELLRIET